MRMLNYFETGPQDGDERTMPVGSHTFPKHRIATRLKDELTLTLANGGGAPHELTQSDLLSIARVEWGEWSMSFGLREEEQVDQSRTLDQMRILAYILTGHDAVIVEGTELRSYQNGTLSIPAGGTRTLKMEFVRPFIFERLSGSKITAWCPGKTQIEQIRIKVKRGGSYGIANVSKSGNSPHTIWVDDADGVNRWAQVARLARTETDGFEHEGPGGALLGLVDTNSTGTQTALVTVSLKREGDESLYDGVDAVRVARGHSLKVPQGSADANELATVLYSPEEQVDMEHLPTASKFVFRQHDTYEAPMRLLWIYVPAVTPSYRDQVVGANVTLERGGLGPEVLGVTLPAYEGQSVSGHIASVAPIALLEPGAPKFQLLPGRKFLRGASPRTQVPEQLVSAIKGSIQPFSGDLAAAKVAQESKALAKAIPGGRSPQRGANTDLVSVFAGMLAPNSELVGAARTFLK